NGAMGVIYQSLTPPQSELGGPYEYAVRWSMLAGDAGTFSAPETLSTNQRGISGPGIAMANGKGFVAWQDAAAGWGGGCSSVVFRERSVWGWSGNVVLPNPAGVTATESPVSVAVDGNGTAALAFTAASATPRGAVGYWRPSGSTIEVMGADLAQYYPTVS